jgi:hypothetical protein
MRLVETFHEQIFLPPAAMTHRLRNPKDRVLNLALACAGRGLIVVR